MGRSLPLSTTCQSSCSRGRHLSHRPSYLGEELLAVVGDHPEQALPSRDFLAEAVADAIVSLLILCTFRNSLKMHVKVQFRTHFRNPKNR